MYCQTARGNYAYAQSYHDFIGFNVAKASIGKGIFDHLRGETWTI